MADTGVFCTTAEVQRKTGENASATANVEAYINDFVGQAESEINSMVRFNFSDAYSSLNNDTRMILKSVASNLAAIMVVQFDMSSYTTRTEAENMINVLRDAALRGLSILRDKKVQDFINGS